MLFKDFAQINPKVDLKKGKTYPYVGMADVNPSRGYVTNSETREYKNSRSKFKEGDTLFARITPCLENGKITRFKSDGIKKGFGSTEFFVFRAKEGVSDPNYVYYLSRSPLIRKTAEKSMAGASGRQRADISAVEEVEIDPPDLPTQQKIASILSAFDDLIENNSRRIEILEEMARRIYREWFVHFRFPCAQGSGEQAIPADGKPKMVDSGTELGEIPEGWEVKSFGDLVEYERDRVKDDDVDKKVSVLGLGDMPKKSITLSEWENTNDIGSTKMRFKKDDILFGKIRPYFHKVGFAQIAGVCSSDIFVWRPKDDKDFVFALLIASSDKFVETATNSSSGTKMPRAKWDVLEKYLVTYPPEELLEKLNSLVGSSLKQIRTLSFQNKRLKETRDLLLPKLISGKIEVD